MKGLGVRVSIWNSFITSHKKEFKNEFLYKLLLLGLASDLMLLHKTEDSILFGLLDHLIQKIKMQSEKGSYAFFILRSQITT